MTRKATTLGTLLILPALMLLVAGCPTGTIQLPDVQGGDITQGQLLNPPEADAGFDKSARVGDTVALSGRGSSDPDGDPLSYQWAFNSGPVTPEIRNFNQETATFVPEAVGDYIFVLTVDDGNGNTDDDTVRISVGEFVADEGGGAIPDTDELGKDDDLDPSDDFGEDILDDIDQVLEDNEDLENPFDPNYGDVSDDIQGDWWGEADLNQMLYNEYGNLVSDETAPSEFGMSFAGQVITYWINGEPYTYTAVGDVLYVDMGDGAEGWFEVLYMEVGFDYAYLELSYIVDYGILEEVGVTEAYMEVYGDLMLYSEYGLSDIYNYTPGGLNGYQESYTEGVLVRLEDGGV